MSEVIDYRAGLIKGTAMSDADCLRFYNGMVAVLTTDCEIYRMQTYAPDARKGIPGLMDALFEAGYIATVGYAGTPVIKPRG